MTKKKISYSLTIKACYIGFFVQAIVVNLTPILFIPLKEQFGLSFGKLGLLVLINFTTQVLVDILFSHSVDKHGYRPYLVTAHVLTILGFSIFALSPMIFANPYIGFVIGTIIFSGAGGLLELLLSPTVNAIPTDEKSSAMSLLHSFYAWGQVAVIIVTTLFLFVFGKPSWSVIMIIWSIPSIVNIILFSIVPIAPNVPEEHRESYKKYIKNSFFIVAIMAIGFGAASEVTMNQWVSAFMEKAMNMPKVIGDVGGMTMFAVMLGLGRLLHGKYGAKMDLNKIMIWGCVVVFSSYIIIAFSSINIISLIACAMCGFAVSLMWPGTLVLTAEQFPLAGTWLFAFLAAGGDIGASIGPWLVGVISDNAVKVNVLANIGNSLGLDSAQLGMRIGMLVAAIFPIGAFLCLRYMRGYKIKHS